jgi:hypothetical protein
MQKFRMNRGVTVVTAIGLVLLGGMSFAVGAENPKKPAEQAVPPAGKTPAMKKDSSDTKASEQKATEKKTPDKKAVGKGGTPKPKPAAAAKASTQAPKYTSAETAASGQACYGEAPKIESIMPDEGKGGQKITISGKNFAPAECLRSISFGPGYPATFKLDNPTQITATVPSGRRSGLAMLTVTTASGEDSKVFAVK